MNPQNQQTLSLKKGRSSWKPANVLDIIDKEPGYRYRVIEKSARNVAKKKREGWEILSGVNNSGNTANAGGNMESGKALDTVLEGYDFVIGRIPEEIALERDAYMNSETNRKTQALYRETGTNLGKSGAPIHGGITMEKRGVKTVIKD